jgi:hypothetical protein
MNTGPQGECRSSSGPEINYRYCPRGCGSQWKTYLNEETGAWVCFRCDARGVVEGYRTKKDRILDRVKSRRAIVDWPEIHLPEWIPLTKMARRYVQERGIPEPEKYGIVSTISGTRVLIPYIGSYGKIIYYTTREIIPDGKPKYITAPGKHPLYILPQYEPMDEEVVIVEGVIDAIVYHEATRKNVIALGGKTLPRYLEPYIKNFARGRKTVMLDSEALNYAFKLARRIGASVKMLPDGEDPASFYSKKERNNGD